MEKKIYNGCLKKVILYYGNVNYMLWYMISFIECIYMYRIYVSIFCLLGVIGNKFYDFIMIVIMGNFERVKK